MQYSGDERAQFSRELGLILQRHRMDSGMSQDRLAAIAGISPYTYFKLEKGESSPGSPANPRIYTLLAITQALGITLEEVLPERRPDVAAGR